MDRKMDIQTNTLLKRFEDASKIFYVWEKTFLERNNPKQHADMMQGIKALSSQAHPGASVIPMSE